MHCHAAGCIFLENFSHSIRKPFILELRFFFTLIFLNFWECKKKGARNKNKNIQKFILDKNKLKDIPKLSHSNRRRWITAISSQQPLQSKAKLSQFNHLKEFGLCFFFVTGFSFYSKVLGAKMAQQHVNSTVRGTYLISKKQEKMCMCTLLHKVSNLQFRSKIQTGWI